MQRAHKTGLPAGFRAWVRPATRAPRALLMIRGRRRGRDSYALVRVNTQTWEFERGGTFPFTIWPESADVSPDAGLFVFSAIGRHFDNARDHRGRWTGLAAWPFAHVSHAWRSPEYYGSSGYFARDGTLMLGFSSVDETDALYDPSVMPMDTRAVPPPCPVEAIGGDFVASDPLRHRIRRDGWRIGGRHPEGDPGEARRGAPGPVFLLELAPTPQHPTLREHILGWSLERRFEVVGHEGRFTGIDDADWDSLGQLIVVRGQWLERWTLEDLHRGAPGAVADLVPFVPSLERPAADTESD